MFYYNYVKLCNKHNKSPSAASEEMGFHRSDVTRWSKGARPRQATLQRIADYFGISVYELVKEEEPSPNDSEMLKFIIEEIKDMTDAELALLKEHIEQIKSLRIKS